MYASGVVIDQARDSVKSYFHPSAPWTWIRYRPTTTLRRRAAAHTVRSQSDRLAIRRQKRLMVMAKFLLGKPRAARDAWHIHPLFRTISMRSRDDSSTSPCQRALARFSPAPPRWIQVIPPPHSTLPLPSADESLFRRLVPAWVGAQRAFISRVYRWCDICRKPRLLRLLPRHGFARSLKTLNFILPLFLFLPSRLWPLAPKRNHG